MRAIAEETATRILKEQFIPDHVFLYIVKGCVQVFDGDKTYIFHKGDAFIARKNRLAKYQLLEDAETFFPILFCFDEPFLKDFQNRHTIKNNHQHTKDGFVPLLTDSRLKNFIDSVMPYYQGVMQLEAEFEDVKYEELLILLLKKYPELAATLFDFTPIGKLNLEEFMYKHFMFNISIPQFALLTGRSLSAFKRDFVKVFHTSPSRWLTQKRLEEAYFRITEQQQKPSGFYIDLGFESLSHFSVAFKKQFNRTPTELAQQ